MDLENRISILVELGEFMQSEDTSLEGGKNQGFSA